MTIELFMFLFTVGSLASSLLTEALKKAFKNLTSNMLALVAALVVGAGGTYLAYVFLEVSLDQKNILCLILMAMCVWVGSMIGYDKVLQTIAQLKGGK